MAIALDTVGSFTSLSPLGTHVLSQKGPEIRTGLMRDGKDVRRSYRPGSFLDLS